MKTRIVCPGSYALSKAVMAGEDTVYSLEGTATHWVGESCLLSGGMLSPIDFTDSSAPNCVFLSEALLTAPQQYVDHVRGVLRELGASESDLEVEKRVDLSWVDIEMFGTSDCQYYHEPTKTIYVWDYKNGYDAVEADDNPQLAFYALDRPEAERAICFIVQPNAGGIRETMFTRAELNQWVMTFRDVAKKCRAATARRVASAQCKFCPAKAQCPENMSETWSRYALTVTTYCPDPTPEQIADEMDAVDAAYEMLKHRRAALNLHAQRMVYDRALTIPRYKLVEGLKQRKYRDEQTVIDYCELMGVDPFKKKLLTPLQLSSIIDIGDLAYKPDGDVKLVKHNARGVPVANKLQNVFQNVTGGIITK